MVKAFQDPKRVDMMTALLNKTDRESLFDFTKALAITQTKSAAGLSMLMQLTQGSFAIGVLTGKEGAAKKAASLFIPTNIMAHMMTKPTIVKLMTSATKTPEWAKQAPTISLKLMEAYEEAKAEVGGTQKPTEAA